MCHPLLEGLARVEFLLHVGTSVCRGIIKAGYAGTSPSGAIEQPEDLLHAASLDRDVNFVSTCFLSRYLCLLRRPATLISLFVTIGLTVMMCKRYQKTHKIMPAGLTALISLAMICFYVWNLLLFKAPMRRQT